MTAISLPQSVATALSNEYSNRAKELHKWADPLSQDQFWRNPYTYGNSVGHLVLHLTGNLSYYIGAQIAGTGYVRHRDVEFTDATRPPKPEVMRKFDETIAMVVTTIRGQSDSDWIRAYSAEREPESEDRFTIFLRCASHLYHHIGQIYYLNRELTK
jgi:Protein of unknown function (DUF1572)